MVDVIGFLFGLLNVFHALRLELHNLVAASENLKQARQHPLYCFQHIAGDNLRTSVDLVAVGLAQVVVKRLFPLPRQHIRLEPVAFSGLGVYLRQQFGIA